MTANLAQALLVAAAVGGALTALVSWWRIPENALAGALPSGSFDVQGIVPIAYAVFAMALGILAGVFFRRTLTAIGTTLVGFVAVRVVIVQFLRPHYIPAAAYTGSLTSQQIPISPRAWLLTKHVTNAAGHIVDNKGAITGPGSWVPKACQGFGSGSEDRLSRCLAGQGFRRLLIFQPPGRFWAFQGIEAGIFVTAAIGLAARAYHQVLRRDA